MTAADPAAKTATDYYEANIGNVTSINEFVGNYWLPSTLAASATRSTTLR